MQYDAFISYRRNSGTYQATALKEALENHGHKERMFMDTYTRKGGPFPKELSEALKESCNLVVVISAKDCFIPKKGEEDYYLREISDALEQGKNIVPVYYDEVKYEDIEGELKNSPYKMKNFPKHQAAFYHNDNPEGSISQINSLLKTEEEILNELFVSLSKERTQIRQDLLYLKEDNSGRCPICQSDYDVTMSYCRKCAYKFFDELDESVAEKNDKIQEKARKKKHKEIWEKSQQNKTSKEKEFKQELDTLKEKIEKLTKLVKMKDTELAKIDQDLSKTKTALEKSNYRKNELEMMLNGHKLEFNSFDDILSLIHSCCKNKDIDSSTHPENAILDYEELRYKLKFYKIDIGNEELKVHQTLGGIAVSIRSRALPLK